MAAPSFVFGEGDFFRPCGDELLLPAAAIFSFCLRRGSFAPAGAGASGGVLLSAATKVHKNAVQGGRDSVFPFPLENSPSLKRRKRGGVRASPLSNHPSRGGGESPWVQSALGMTVRGGGGAARAPRRSVRKRDRRSLSLFISSGGLGVTVPVRRRRRRGERVRTSSCPRRPCR